MDPINLQALKTKADALGTDLAANDAANAAEHAAAVELLGAVVRIAQPAVKAIGDKCRGVSGRALILRHKRTGQGYAVAEGRLLTFFYDGTDQTHEIDDSVIALTPEGLREMVYSGTWSGDDDAIVAATREVDLADHSTVGLEQWIDAIREAVERAGTREKATTAAIARADKMRALAALLGGK